MSAKRVLVVDDDEVVIIVLKAYIERMLPDYQVIAARDGLAALTEFRKQPFDLILTDYYMPKMNGLELALAVQQIAADVPIVLMTGRKYTEIQSKLGASNLSGFLAKPFSMPRLKEILQKVGVKSGESKKEQR